MSDTVTVTVIHDCKKCKDEGAYVTHKLVKCEVCNAYESQEDVDNWLYVDEDGNKRVKSGLHLEKEPGKTWQLKEFN